MTDRTYDDLGAEEREGIFGELTRATGVKPRKGEDPQGFARRLAGAVDRLGDDEWRELSEPAQLWTNAAISKADGGAPISLAPGMPGSDAVDDEAPDDLDEDEFVDDAIEDDNDEDDEDEDEGEEEDPPVTRPRAGAAKTKRTAKRGGAGSRAPSTGAVASKKDSTSKPSKASKASPKASKSTKATGGVNKDTAKSTRSAKSTNGGRVPDAKTRADSRSSTKRDELLKMLRRSKGATYQEIADALGWLPHTARAAVSTQIRGAGHEVSSKREGVRGMVYRVAS